MPRFVEYDETDLFPYPPERVWKLLQLHNDPRAISEIHPLIRRQTVLSTSGEDTLLERVIDARGRLLTSRWKVTYRPPDYSGYEVVAGEGPWANGTRIENRYQPAPGGTLVRRHVKVRIQVLPFFLPQGSFARRILGDIDREDRVYLERHP